MPAGGDATDPVNDATDQLYAAPPEEFLVLRTNLSATALESGDRVTATAIKALRKPTLAASLVNRLILQDRSRADDLQDLGDRLRAAQEDLDATVMRELSLQRRQLVAALTEAAMRLCARPPGSTVRDEVTNTLDAAIADPDITTRLGRLTRAERWSGFGLAATGPDLTLVRGGRDTGSRPRKRTDSGTTKTGTTKTGTTTAGTTTAGTTKATTAARRRAQRSRAKAQDTFDAAENALTAAAAAEQELVDRIHRLTGQLAGLQSELDGAKNGLTRTRRETKAARVRRREARSALDRAERLVERTD